MSSTPRQVSIVALILAPALLAGCTEDDGCGTPSLDQLVVGVTWPPAGSDRLDIAFDCEMVDADYTIDRYDFRLALGRGGIVDLAPDPADLADQGAGSVTYFVQTGADGAPTVVQVAPRDEGAFFKLDFQRWDPEVNEAREPRIVITWDQDADGEGEVLPGGLYGVRLALRSGTDSMDWVVTSIDY